MNKAYRIQPGRWALEDPLRWRAQLVPGAVSRSRPGSPVRQAELQCRANKDFTRLPPA